MLHKAYSNTYVILFSIPFAYVHPAVDSVPVTLQVDAVELGEHDQVVTVAQAIELYLEARRQKFTGSLGAVRKRQRLQRFLAYLTAQHHSLQLCDLTSADGAAFLRFLIHHNDRKPLSPATLADYKGGLRTFSRFLFKSQLISEDVFFALGLE